MRRPPVGAAPPPPYCTDQGGVGEVPRPAERSLSGDSRFSLCLPPHGVSKRKAKKRETRPVPPSAPMGDGGNGRPFPQSLRVSQNLAGVKGREIFSAAGATQKNFPSPCGALDTAENLTLDKLLLR